MAVYSHCEVLIEKVEALGKLATPFSIRRYGVWLVEGR
jgi:hypothetical protein